MTISKNLRGIVAIAATYVYFLLFAQFAFLKQIQLHFPAAPDVERTMAAMGLAGFVASLAAGAALRKIDGRRLLMAGFLGAAATALVSTLASGLAVFAAVAVLAGGFTGIVTVALAADLRALVYGPRFGLAVGLGTGAAYFFCNVPPIFEGDPAFQSVVAAAVCLVGLGAAAGRQEPAESDFVPPAGLSRRDFRGLGFVSVVLSFLALIWLDSAAFAVIQEEAALKGLTWGTGLQKLVQGGTHLLAAVAAGWLVDRGHFRSLLVAAFALFAVSFTFLGQGAGLLTGPIYAVGISLYSVALVVYPAAWRDEDGLVPQRWRAAAVYGVAGWIGSALGVGMAQELHHVPRLFLWIVGGVLAAGWVLGRGGRVPTLVRAHAATLLCGAAALVVYAALDVETASERTPVERGQHVYVQEGCIHCHSQYVRPASVDSELYGPYRALDRQTSQPLIGNRRQGPDLTNAGSRRSAAWHRLHLTDPRALVPGSRMPSYAHLFAGDNPRGEDLVAYLASLGADQAENWYAFTQDYPIAEGTTVASAGHGQEVFRGYCVTCHGVEGRGDGPLAEAVYRPAMNLRKETFWDFSWGPDTEPEPAALARVVKFGVSGTSMPGHEYLTDQEIADVVAYVRALRARDEPLRAAVDGDEEVGHAG